ncbi:3-ketosteroid-9-alpha-hydroxylase reductase subunit [Mycobacteroides abscessus subsp. abscessus]|nr:3-ketosteroid-9-alpha-hydroxylase reductase subunit [Mycobacteroides abscessus subsp. abscessus]
MTDSVLPDTPRVTGNPHVHSLEVVEIIRETGDAVSLVFEVPDALVDAFRYRPGQFLTLKIPSEQTGSVARCYSLSSSPHLDDDLVVTVKRTDGGYASNWLCDNVGVGDHITVLTPSGVFVPRSLDSDFLLIAAGSGITPMLSIAKSVLLGGAGTVYLFYANRDAQSVIFGAEIDDIMVEFPDRLRVVHWLEAERGLPTRDAMSELFAAYTRYSTYLCGPAPFDGTRVTVEWPRNTPLLDVLLARGIDAPYSCREGACSACACTVRRGEVRMLRNDTLVDADLAMGLTLACQAVPVTDSVDIAFDQ